MTLDEFLENKEKVLKKPQTSMLLSKFKENYIALDYDPKNQKRSWLLNCNLRCTTKWISTDDFGTIQMEHDKPVYIYCERQKEMFGVTFGEIYDVVTNFEPWDELDALVFDDSFGWYIAINHEDITGLHNVETSKPGTGIVFNNPFGSKQGE